jgi:hypothetical protein
MASLDAAAISTKLKSAPGAELLAQRWINDVMAQRLDALFVPAHAASALMEVLKGLAASDSAEALMVERAEAICARFEKEGRALSEVLPAPLADTVLTFAARPHPVQRQLVLRVLDREPVRELIRALLLDALIDFGKRLASPVSGSRMGKGLGALGSLAGAVGAGVLGAVGGEFEKGVERKAAEFADAGLSRILQRIVEKASDPRQAREQAELRAALVEGVLEVPVQELIAEVRRSDPRAVAAEARRALQHYTARPEVASELEAELTLALAPFAQETLGAFLERLGIRDPISKSLQPLLVARIQAFDWDGMLGSLAALP